MKIRLQRISVRNLVAGCHNDSDDVVRGYGGIVGMRCL